MVFREDIYLTIIASVVCSIYSLTIITTQTMGVSVSTARLLAPSAWAYDFAMQQIVRSLHRAVARLLLSDTSCHPHTGDVE
jgi:hypothetical protein